MYTVELWVSPMPLPIPFAVHAYLVTKTDQSINRFEQISRTARRDCEPMFGTVYKNFLPATTGLRWFGFIPEWRPGKLRYKPNLLGAVSGEEYSVAHQLFKILEEGGLNKYKNAKYQMIPGPNSNTFVQWVLDQVPESGLRLPWNAFGKGFEIES